MSAIAIMLVTASAGIGFADDEIVAPTPQKNLAKAIEAHGEKNNILKPRKGYLKGADKITKGISFEETFDFPTHWKMVQVDHFDGKKHTATVLMADGKFWEWKEGGQAQPLNEADIMVASVFGLLMKLSELEGPKWKLSPIKDMGVGDEVAVGFRAKWGKKYVADFYFDKTTGLLVRSDCILELGPKRYHQKMIYSEYKEMDGVIVPTRKRVFLKGDGFADFMPMADIFVTEIRIVDKLPAGTFTRPKEQKEQ